MNIQETGTGPRDGYSSKGTGGGAGRPCCLCVHKRPLLPALWPAPPLLPALVLEYPSLGPPGCQDLNHSAHYKDICDPRSFQRFRAVLCTNEGKNCWPKDAHCIRGKMASWSVWWLSWQSSSTTRLGISWYNWRGCYHLMRHSMRLRSRSTSLVLVAHETAIGDTIRSEKSSRP